jgi:RNA-directed DNA polymerase
MESWSTHYLYREALKSIGPTNAAALRDYAKKLIDKRVAVVFTLGHLAKICGVDYRLLRESVGRRREAANYRMYAVAKRSGGRRFIHSVAKDLFRVQDFINRDILQHCPTSSYSYAFHSSGGIRRCAAQHCGASWLLQYDLRDYFYSINEAHVYRVFTKIGYSPLLSFELGRLCTTLRVPNMGGKRLFPIIPTGRIIIGAEAGADRGRVLPYPIHYGHLGVLPQGAPTSPMLSNLASVALDNSLGRFAYEQGLVYSRYADDITFSSSTIKRRLEIAPLNAEIVRIIRANGFRENAKKTRIAGPGSKKLVLGLLVNGSAPRISRQAYKRIDRHLHACEKYGVTAVADHEGFDSALGFHNHLGGLVAYVKDVDESRWSEFKTRYDGIEVPWN